MDQQGHKFQGSDWRTWGCSCARASYNAKRAKSAREMHAEHVAQVKAREAVTKALERWEGSSNQLFCDVENLQDWADRDQEEMTKCGDEDTEKEARNNRKIVKELCTAFAALLVLDGWKSSRYVAPAKTKSDSQNCPSCEGDMLGRPFDGCKQADAHDA